MHFPRFSRLSLAANIWQFSRWCHRFFGDCKYYPHLFTNCANFQPRIEQNVVIVAACIPTLRPLFRKVFKSTTDSTGEATLQKGTGSGFKLSYNSLQRSKRTLSAAELPLKNIKQKSSDAESSNSQSGIWQTREVLVESDDDRSFGRPHV